MFKNKFNPAGENVKISMKDSEKLGDENKNVLRN